MPRTRTTITSERARELGRRAAAAVGRDPKTNRFVKKTAPPQPPPAVTDPPAPPAPPPPVSGPGTVPSERTPGFRMARSLFHRGRRA